MHMKNFQIIAIKTGFNGGSVDSFLKDCKETAKINYLKNLDTDKVYSFNKCYTFLNNDFSEIKYEEENDIDLYSIKLSKKRTIPVNICAVVGGNGSGKSALLELLYWINYNIACQLELLENEQGELYQPNTLNLELLYSIESQYVCIKVGRDNSEYVKFNLNENPYNKKFTKIDSSSNINVLSDYFYSIVINYSQYALNAKEVGIWVNPLFHKNDGYQTPIVLNPMRIDGNIDVNTERELLSRRLQSNVLEPIYNNAPTNSIRNLANGKIANTFRVEYITTYFTIKNESIPREAKDKITSRIKDEMADIFTQNEDLCSEVITRCYQPRVESEIEIIEGLARAIETCFDFNLSKISNDFKNVSLRYISKKLLRMVRQYRKVYKKFIYNDEICDINGFLAEIKTSNSHTAFKVKGAILHLKNYERIYGALNADPTSIDSFDVNIEAFSNLIQEIRAEEIGLTEINNYIMAFPPFFKVTVLPEDDGLAIKDFSSGEKQKINSLSSIIYHLINLNSVEEKEGNIRYKYFNLILDEIELYYHPEWQRTYINDLLQYISKVNPSDLKNIKGINIIFATHSPFILSDIPNSKIIRLKEGKESKILEEQTFSANIHDLLANDFFMQQGLMGEFAKQKIKSLIDYLEKPSKRHKSQKEEWDKVKAYKFISLIGEPLIRNSLRDLYNKTFIECDVNSIQKEIDRLQLIKDKMQPK